MSERQGGATETGAGPAARGCNIEPPSHGHQLAHAWCSSWQLCGGMVATSGTSYRQHAGSLGVMAVACACQLQARQEYLHGHSAEWSHSACSPICSGLGSALHWSLQLCRRCSTAMFLGNHLELLYTEDYHECMQSPKARAVADCTYEQCHAGQPRAGFAWATITNLP